MSWLVAAKGCPVLLGTLTLSPLHAIPVRRMNMSLCVSCTDVTLFVLGLAL